MDQLLGVPEAWKRCFRIDDGSGEGGIRLRQLDRKRFALGSTIEFTGPSMGLEKLELSDRDERALRIVTADELAETDLASVPGPFRWWSPSYGVHTPAALIHDKFIGEAFTSDPDKADSDMIYRPRDVTDAHIDRYFRFMLRALGVMWARRWLMWAAVAARSRYHGGHRKRALMIVWMAVAVFGIHMLATSWEGWRVWESADTMAALLLPIPAAATWGRQWGAGLVISYIGIPLLLPPALVAVPCVLSFFILEAVVASVGRSRADLAALLPWNRSLP